MRSRLLPALCLALVLLGLAGTIYKIHFPPGPIADEAAYVMMTQSLWHEHDLTYDHRDLLRAYRLWDQGPYGVILFTRDGGKTMHYGKPFAYSLAAVPFYVLFGAQGLVVFNMAIYLAMFFAAWWYFERVERVRKESGAVTAYVAGFFFASVSLAYVFWMQPEVFNMGCVFFPLLLWQVLRKKEVWSARDYWLLAGAGLLLAAAYMSKEPTVVLGAPIAADLALRRPFKSGFKGVLALAAPLLLGLVLMMGVQHRLTGTWSPYRDVQRRSFETDYPIESKKDLWQAYRGTSFGSWSGLGVETSGRMLARNVGYFFLGRHTGLLPYFPFAVFALGLYLAGPKDRSRHLLLLAVAGYCLLFLVMRPNNYHGGAGFLGNRYFASIYPALLFLPGRMAARRILLLPFAAAGLWTASVIAMPLQAITPEATLQAHVRTPAFQALPLELTLIGYGRIPGYAMRDWGQGVWVLPKVNFFWEEIHPNGIWVRGASRSEVIVVSTTPLDTLRFRVASLSADNELTLDSGVEKVIVRFDSEAKRAGTPVELKIRPIARNLGFFPAAPQEHFYRLVLTDTDGVMPAHRNPQDQDYRYLGVFLDFTGGGI
jgi:hypothetical protein